MAHFEVYILNYNGKHFLPECLEALDAVERGSHSLTVNVVDNASTDGSDILVLEEYPEVHFIALDKNYGFSLGNNLGVAHRRQELAAQGTRADFHVLLNNDTQVDSQWLLAAYDAFMQQENVGIVGSKALFYDSFIPLRITCDTPYCPSNFGIADPRQMGPALRYGCVGVNVQPNTSRSKYKDVYRGHGDCCVLSARSEVYIPVEDSQKAAWGYLFFENHHPARLPLSLSITKGQHPSPHNTTSVEIPANGPCPIAIQADPQDYVNCIQNAGSFVTQDWYAGDRGFLTSAAEHFSQVEQVAAICGVSMFVRDEVWSALGGFDEAFFAYYEDTDLSIRAQQLGWKCLYTPHSQLRHVHCGSGVEFSEYFLRNVSWSHLLFASKTMNRRQWSAKRAELRSAALHEFEQFRHDHTLTGKPSLRAYVRYLQNMPTFISNRTKAYRAPVQQTLADVLAPATTSVAQDQEDASTSLAKAEGM